MTDAAVTLPTASLLVASPEVLAHVSHWAVNLLYVAPVLLIGVALAVAARRHPAADRDGEGRPR